ncbi:hypothetical protein GCM10007981_03480 [Thermocladium modestius]|uniref:Phosphoglycolate phosphatase n=1 Tax=Thermocladium modestius TaxID=62609 RepID=A0A830GU32_9CREN|nr:HAD hydrolase-like protein [Thermocladium modestius]GGP19509.1 hypothetical protein GCM10007981_03480 [Thermocladium modestius]
MIEWVVFDLDMTLLDTFRGFYSAFMKCVEEHGARPPPSFDSFLADYEENLLRSYVPGGADSFRFWRRCWSIYVEAGEVGRPIPGMAELVKRLKDEGRRIIVATGREMESGLVRREMEAAGVSGVDAVHSLGDLGRGTKLDLLRVVIETHGIIPRLAAYVTDTPRDVEAGVAVGFNSIGFASWTRRFPGVPVASTASDVYEIIKRLDAEQ